MLYALSDPNRLRIVRIIDRAGGELSCGSFSKKLDLSKPTLSHHFRILRESGVLGARIEGTQKMNFIRREELDRRFPGLIKSIMAALK